MKIVMNPRVKATGVAMLAAAGLGLAAPVLAQPGPAKADGVFSFHDQRPTFHEDHIKDIQVVVSGADSEGRLSMITSYWLPSFVASPHYHTHHAETFYTLSGAVKWTIGGETHIMHAGDLVHIPAYTAHTITVVGDEPAHMIMIQQPGGYEHQGDLVKSYTEEQREDPDVQDVITYWTDFNRLSAANASPAIPEGQPPKAVPVFSFHGKRPSFSENKVADVQVDLSSAQSEGRLSIVESKWLPGFQVPPHYHQRHSETFYIIDGGKLQWTIGGETHVIGPKDAVFIPPNTLHSVKVVGDKPVHMLWIGDPGGLDLGSVATSGLTEEQQNNPAVKQVLKVLGDFHTMSD